MTGDHPRLRGEHFDFEDDKKPDKRITPAYAGNTKCTMLKRQITRDHPRLRGEHRVKDILLPLI